MKGRVPWISKHAVGVNPVNSTCKSRAWRSLSRNCLSVFCSSYDRSVRIDSSISQEDEETVDCTAVQRRGLSGIESQSFCQPRVRPLVYFPKEDSPSPFSDSNLKNRTVIQ